MAWTEEARRKAQETKKLKGITNQFTKAKTLGFEIPQSVWKGKVGQFKDKKHSEETKLKQQEKALASKHRRLRRKMIEYNGIMLDSTWELLLAKKLDAENIIWVRPGPIDWVDTDGLTHHYFPDFYLPEHDLYLDPKNPKAYEVQYKKIEQLKTQLTNLVILCSISEIENFTVS